MAFKVKDVVVSNLTSPEYLANLLKELATAAAEGVLTPAGLAIKATSSAVVKSSLTYVAIVDGVLVLKTAGDMAALAGTIATLKYGLWVFTIDSAGTVATIAGTLTGETVAELKFPSIPNGQAIIGFVIVQNGSVSTFTGGSTALDATNITATYVDTPGGFNPDALSDET